MKKILFIISLLAGYALTAQTLVLEKGNDTLMAKNLDTIYKVDFKLTGIQIGNVPVVKVFSTIRGTAANGVEYALYDQDSVKVDSISVRARNNTGSFLFYLTKGLTQVKSAVLSFIIIDGGKVKTSQDTIILIPYKEPDKPKAPAKQDSLVLRLTREIDIPVYDSSMIYKKHWYKSKDTLTRFSVNIDSVNVERNPDGKYRITVFTADGEIYSNPDYTDFTNWDRTYQLKRDGAGKPYLLMKDFLELNEDKKENQSQSLTPQHKAIKLPKK